MVAGLGYVGLSNAVMLAAENQVVGYDVDPDKVALINSGVPPFQDADLEKALSRKSLRLNATSDEEEAFLDADIVVIATPTNFDEKKNSFATDTVEATIETAFKYAQTSKIVIRSTVPAGFTRQMQKKFNSDRILFCPEFLREGRGLFDNLNPSRIIVGGPAELAGRFAQILKAASEKPNVDILLMSSTEAEAVKLFSNSYLAMRVAFFNELDSYALSNGLDVKNIIDGIGYDPRIGDHHNLSLIHI